MGDVRVNPFEPELRSTIAFLRSIPAYDTTSEEFTRDYLRGFLHLDVELDYVLEWNADGATIETDSDLPPETLVRIHRTIFVCYAIYQKLFEIGHRARALTESFFSFHPHLPTILMNLFYPGMLRRYPDSSERRVLASIPTGEMWIKQSRDELLRVIFRMCDREDCWYFINNSIDARYRDSYIGEYADSATLDILLENGYAPNWHTLHGALKVHNVCAVRRSLEFGVLHQEAACRNDCCKRSSPAFKCFTFLNLEIMDLCLMHGGNPYELDIEKNNILHAFLKNVSKVGMKDGPGEGIRKLIGYGVDVNGVNQYGNYPLYYAENLGLEDIKLLVEAGANIHRIDREGRNVFSKIWTAGVRDYFVSLGAVEPVYKYKC